MVNSVDSAMDAFVRVSYFGSLDRCVFQKIVLLEEESRLRQKESELCALCATADGTRRRDGEGLQRAALGKSKKSEKVKTEGK